MNLVLAVTGASGAHAAALLMEQSPWPVALVATPWGRDVYAREVEPFEELAERAATVYDEQDLAAAISSGSTETAGMVILPCSCSMLGQIAAGLGENLVARAAHCQLKERRPLVLCVRETPWTLIDIENAQTVAAAGGVIMPMCLPFYEKAGEDPSEAKVADLMSQYVQRVLALVGRMAQA